jgi:hypothetical protein
VGLVAGPHGHVEAEVMQNLANTSPGTAEPAGKKSLKDRAVSELEKYAVITAYLWVLFALFGLHRQLVQGHGVSGWQQGFAIINALVFGKVMLIGEAFELGKATSSQALAWVVVRKSLIFALLLIAFHIGEEAIRAWFKGLPLSDAITSLGGSLGGVAAFAAIFFVVLIPFYALQETGRVLGSDALWRLFFKKSETHFRLSED